ncbi:DUF3105 domain-containing protein [Pseudarthrobacter oxydans]|nr:DUF3105 domain-containing protein [Pseudarthrobacter oxydans]NSX38907.1 DUF3105 domain-containing protein [Pseudarthrobacter oxydans]
MTSGKSSKQARQDGAAKLALVKAQQARRATRRRIAAVIGSLTAVGVVVGLVLLALVNDPAPQARGDIEVTGLQTFSGLSANHVKDPVSYQQAPPVGGDHSPVWLNCGVYGQPVPDENAVHALEHGAIWATYDPARITAAQAEALQGALPDTYAVLSPLEGTSSPIMLTAWGAQVGVDSPEDERIELFVSKYWQSPDAPEPGATCTGGLDAPGRK